MTMLTATTKTATTSAPWFSPDEFPILAVLDPRRHRRLVGVSGFIALWVCVTSRIIWGWQLWQAVAAVLVIMAIPMAIKWRDDAVEFGFAAAVASALLTIQGLHSIEHLAQWSQRHLLNLPLRESNGLLSPANSEWVHFLWNWAVLVVLLVLWRQGLRGIWAYALLGWAFAHTLEHTYMFVRYLQISAEMRSLGVSEVTAQGLPGIVGEGGWLDLVAGPRLQAICGFPLLTTADRVDTHFVWNTGEIALMIPAVRAALRSIHRNNAALPR